MKTECRYKIFTIALAVLWLISCIPHPQVRPLPEIELSAEIDRNECGLRATLNEPMDGDYEAGFYYGLSEEDMINVAGQWDSSTSFSARLTSLEYDAEYLYKSYLSNGYNEICSDLDRFSTQADEGQNADNGENGAGSMFLPFNEITVGTMDSEFTVEVGGDADFIVSIQPEDYWVTCTTGGRECRFYVYANNNTYDRSCDIRFFNLANDEYEVLTIYQPAVSMTESNLPYNYIEIAADQRTFEMMLLEELFGGFRWLYDDNPGGWLKWSWRTEWKYLDFEFEAEENMSSDDRMCRLIVTYDGFDSVLTVVQKGRAEFFDFADPVVEKACLGAFDVDGDSRLSVDEVLMVPIDGLDVLDFSGADISSFEEMRFFQTVTQIHQPVFAGTSLKKVRMPKNLCSLQNGVFKDCVYLQDMEWLDLVNVSVGKEVFRGCKSLKWVDTRVEGESAFENCTSLSGVNQRVSEVPPYAFKNCESLGLFEFDAYGEGRHYIGEGAFLGCVSLPEFTIPEDIVDIQDKAFYGCRNLVTINMYPVNPPVLGEDVFAGTSSDLKIYVPSQSVDLYKSSWPSLADRIVVR